MEVAAQHAERERLGSGQEVKERLFLDRVDLQSSHVSMRHAKRSVAIEANLADSTRTRGNQTAMSAGEAADAVVRERIHEQPGDGTRIEMSLERLHSGTRRSV
jgi:hypothetical protein